MVVGPFMLGWVRSQGLVSDLGEIGLLYLMFLAGLSFNIRAFMKNRSNALVYGILGFVIPFGPWRLMRRPRDISLMIVAGPHRLSVARSSVQRNLHGIVDATDQTYESQQSTVNS